MTIDLDQLNKLANDPNMSTKAAFEQLGFNNYATFDYQLKKNPEAERIWKEGRAAAAGERTQNTTSSIQPATNTKKSNKERPSKRNSSVARTPPPQWQCQEWGQQRAA